MIKKLLLTTLVLIVAFAFVVNATDNQKSIKQLTDEAESIIIGKVAKQKSEWDSNHKMIYTTVTVAVNEYLKGDDGSKTQIIKIPGGKVGDVGLEVVGAPSFDDGEKALLFLGSSPDKRKEKTIIGWNKGKVTLDDAIPLKSLKKQIKSHLGIVEEGPEIPEMIQFPDPDLLINRAKKYKPTTGNISDSEAQMEDNDWGWKCVWGDNFEYDFPYRKIDLYCFRVIFYNFYNIFFIH